MLRFRSDGLLRTFHLGWKRHAVSLLVVATSTPVGGRIAEAAEVVRARVPTVLVMLTPPGRTLSVPYSTLLESASAAIEWRTDLEVLRPERVNVDPGRLARCGARQRMTCWARVVADAHGRNDQPVQYAWLVVGQPVSPGQDRLYTLMLDIEAVRRIYRTAPRTDADWRERVEDWIFRSTPQSRPIVVDSSEPGQVDAYFDKVVRETLRDPLVEKGRWWPSGRLLIEGTEAGLTVEIDRNEVTTTTDDVTEIGPLRAGLREVVIRGPDDHEVREVVQVPVGGQAKLDWFGPPKETPASRTITRWGGLGLLAAGVVVTGIGFAQAQDVEGVCIVREGEPDCPGLGAPTLGFDPGQAPTTNPDDINPPGLQISSLGLAMISTGATWSAGAWWLESEDVPLWMTWLAGLAAGGLTYAVSALAQGG